MYSKIPTQQARLKPSNMNEQELKTKLFMQFDVTEKEVEAMFVLARNGLFDAINPTFLAANKEACDFFKFHALELGDKTEYKVKADTDEVDLVELLQRIVKKLSRESRTLIRYNEEIQALFDKLVSNIKSRGEEFNLDRFMVTVVNYYNSEDPLKLRFDNYLREKALIDYLANKNYKYFMNE